MKNFEKFKSFNDLKDGTKVISFIDNMVTEFKIDNNGEQYLCSKKSMWPIYQFTPDDFVIYTGEKDIYEIDSSFFVDFESLVDEISYQNLDEIDKVDTLNKIKELSSENDKIQTLNTPYWNYFMNANDSRINNVYGKFMIFKSKSFLESKEGIEFLDKLKSIVELGIIPVIKYATDKKSSRSKVICLYTTKNKYEMRSLCSYLVNNKVVKPYYHKGEDFARYDDFKYKTEEQTKNDIYGDEFYTDLSFETFVDLKTGKMNKIN